MNLTQIKRGQRAVIVAIEDRALRLQALRMGLNPGQIVECAEAIPAGPLIVRCRFQDTAIGRRLAGQIKVRPCLSKGDGLS